MFDTDGKALARLTLAQHNMGSVKLNSDGRNSISRECPPQARATGGLPYYSSFFLVPFSFGNERKRNSARRANTTRFWAITIKEHNIRSPQLRYGCPLTRTCRINATKSPLGLFKEISPKRNFFQRDPRRGSLSLHAALRHANSLLLRFADASRGAAPTPRKPSRRLDPSFVSRYASKS